MNKSLGPLAALDARVIAAAVFGLAVLLSVSLYVRGNRYELTGLENGRAYKLDRWTGEVSFLEAGQQHTVAGGKK